MSEMYEVCINVNGKDVKVTVHDLETANLLLNDQDAALAFVQGMPFAENVNDDVHEDEDMSEVVNEGRNLNEGIVIWTRRKPTDIDNEATTLMLSLRLKLSQKFDDKKTNKHKLWADISDELQAKGFTVGTNGPERCRQKFANLCKPYYSYIKHQKTTGEGHSEEPAYFDELHAILGTKHKTVPAHLEDTFGTSQSEDVLSDNSNPSTSTAGSAASDRFKKTKLKPASASQQLLKEVQLDRELRSEQFGLLLNTMKRAEEQKDRLLQILEKSLNKACKKRKHDEDSE